MILPRLLQFLKVDFFYSAVEGAVAAPFLVEGEAEEDLLPSEVEVAAPFLVASAAVEPFPVELLEVENSVPSEEENFVP